MPSISFLEPSPDLAYIIGVVAGDGSACRIRMSRGGEYRMKANAKDVEFIKKFARCLGSVLNRDPPKPRTVEEKLSEVKVQSKSLYDLLRKPIDIDRIRRFVEHSEDCVRSFLRGFFDSGRSVSETKRNKSALRDSRFRESSGDSKSISEDVNC